MDITNKPMNCLLEPQGVEDEDQLNDWTTGFSGR
jgi:hypothetical protein